jgi:hypothetical protein
LSTIEAEALKVELLDKAIDDADRVVLADKVIEAFGQQCDLASILSFDESLHAARPLSRVATP